MSFDLERRAEVREDAAIRRAERIAARQAQLPKAHRRHCPCRVCEERREASVTAYLSTGEDLK